MGNTCCFDEKPPGPFVHSKLQGYLKKEYQKTDEKFTIYYPIKGMDWKLFNKYKHNYANQTYSVVKIHNARIHQEQATSTMSFFKDHSFVLLQSPTGVKDWNTDWGKGDTDITNIYHKEIDNWIRNHIFENPDEIIHKIDQPHAVIRRGKKQQNPFYAQGVHQDYGLNPEEYTMQLSAYGGSQEMVKDFLEKFDAPEIKGFTVICFWRPFDMKKPCQHMPLAVCDPNSVKKEDVIPTALYGFTPTGQPTSQLSLRLNDDQQWYYYPNMTNDEVLAFKQFEYFKGVDDKDDEPFKTCFHTAFKDPTTPCFAEARKSCEHRVLVFFK